MSHPRPPYAKVYRSMLDGTLGPPADPSGWQVLTVMLLHAERDGTVDLTPEALAARSNMPVEHVRRGIEMLEAPDERSRTPGNDGRRITRLDPHRDWGWRIVNHALYRASTDAERAAEYRAREGEAGRERDRERKRVVRSGPSRSVTVRDGTSPSTGIGTGTTPLPQKHAEHGAAEQGEIPGTAPDRDPAESVVVIELPSRGTGVYRVTEAEARRLEALHPGVDVRLQLRKMLAWLDANKRRRKVDLPRFVTNWLIGSPKAGHRRTADAQWAANNRENLGG